MIEMGKGKEIEKRHTLVCVHGNGNMLDVRRGILREVWDVGGCKGFLGVWEECFCR